MDCSACKPGARPGQPSLSPSSPLPPSLSYEEEVVKVVVDVIAALLRRKVAKQLHVEDCKPNQEEDYDEDDHKQLCPISDDASREFH